MVAGLDLTKEEHQKEVERCIQVNKPFVVITGPPRTGFGHWSLLCIYVYIYIYIYIHPDTWSLTRQIGEHLVASAARVCKIQSSSGSHLLVENLAGSELFGLPCSQEIWNTDRVVRVNVPQCTLGLMVGGQPVYKNTI